MAENNRERSRPGESPLVVIDRLDVGPARVEPRRVVMPYTVRTGSTSDSFDLIFKYTEDVFDPSDEGAVNVAHMVGAQVALNYGLFCRRIVFHGLFADVDRRFILDMMENTSREILVKKFLEPNPFLTADAPRVEPVRQDRYTNAEVEFPDLAARHGRSRWKHWETSRDRHAILSSGGKDSLLSYGLLKELGKECYPIYANESGRHWFTALNAFRHFEKEVPDTQRVWMNSDRLFSWMLRHLPFIRPDFAELRADEYPIRLWTVAVFLFGAIPLMHKYGIGRVVIGDEFDTTARTSFQGITHYDGLFDQSRLFDNALSRYYLRKGWAISQFSILRPLSELLIEKILVERYPDLQRLQTSCHATHVEGEHMRPCGRCEKCRRIVAMLVALGADPRACGYTDAQIEACLKLVAGKGVHQEASGRRHLNWLLHQGGHVRFPAESTPGGPSDEVMHLRFDPRRSRIEEIPVDLRRPLLEIYGHHTAGALARDKRRWVPLDPHTLADMEAPYPYEFEETQAATTGSPGEAQRSLYVWGELTWPIAEKVLDRVDVALLPVGAIEQHGPHLPLDTDTFDAEYLAGRVAEACSEPRPLVVPVIAYGVSYHHEDFKGTLSVGNETLSRYVYDVGMSLARNGINKLVILNGHGGNAPALNHAAQMINRDAHIFVCVDTGETSDVDIEELCDTPNDVHAGEIETSTTLAVRPHLVDMSKAEAAIPRFSSRYLDFTSMRGVPWHAYTSRISPSGVMGDPTRASAEKGRRMWEIMAAHLVALVEDLKRLTLDQIHQRRY